MISAAEKINKLQNSNLTYRKITKNVKINKSNSEKAEASQVLCMGIIIQIYRPLKL